MHAQVLQVRFGNEDTQGIGHAADTELQGNAVVQIGENILGNLLIDGTRFPVRRQTDRFLAFDNGMDFRNVDVVAAHAKDDGHVGIDFDDNRFRRIEHFLGAAIGQAKGKIAVLVHGSYSNHGYIDRRKAPPIVGAAVAEQHRFVISPAGV